MFSQFLAAFLQRSFRKARDGRSGRRGRRPLQRHPTGCIAGCGCRWRQNRHRGAVIVCPQADLFSLGQIHAEHSPFSRRGGYHPPAGYAVSFSIPQCRPGKQPPYHSPFVVPFTMRTLRKTMTGSALWHRYRSRGRQLRTGRNIAGTFMNF